MLDPYIVKVADKDLSWQMSEEVNDLSLYRQKTGTPKYNW